MGARFYQTQIPIHYFHFINFPARTYWQNRRSFARRFTNFLILVWDPSSNLQNPLRFHDAATPEIYASPRKRAANGRGVCMLAAEPMLRSLARKRTCAFLPYSQKQSHTTQSRHAYTHSSLTLIYLKKNESWVLRFFILLPSLVLNPPRWTDILQISGNIEICGQKFSGSCNWVLSKIFFNENNEYGSVFGKTSTPHF